MATGDRLLDALGNVMLDASGNIMLDDGSGNSCCCCGCATLTTAVCFACAAGCTPRFVRLVFSGVTTFCQPFPLPPFPFTNYSASVQEATIAFTRTLEGGGVDSSHCTWSDTDTAGANTYNARIYNSNTTCSGTPDSQHDDILTEVRIISHVGSTPTIQVDTSSFVTGLVPFIASVPFVSCSGTVVFNNGDGGATPVGGSGGTCTLTWCP